MLQKPAAIGYWRREGGEGSMLSQPPSGKREWGAVSFEERSRGYVPGGGHQYQEGWRTTWVNLGTGVEAGDQLNQGNAGWGWGSPGLTH